MHRIDHCNLLSERARQINPHIMHDIQRRNTAIRKHFYELLGQGMPIMLAYAMTGKEFYLSEKRVRDIIAKRK